MPVIKEPIAILAAKRTPLGVFNGYARDYSAPQLAGRCLRGLLDTAPDLEKLIHGQAKLLTILGCALQGGLGQNPCRRACAYADLHAHRPWLNTTITVNHVCGSGMTSIIQACQAIQLGLYPFAVAGGMENMTKAPYMIEKGQNEDLAGCQNFLKKPLVPESFQSHAQLDGITDFNSGDPMTALAERTAQKYGLQREETDAYTLISFQKAKEALEQGYFREEIIPFVHETPPEEPAPRGNASDQSSHCAPQIVFDDEGFRKVIPTKFPRLKPHIPGGILTPATISAFADGAACLILAGKKAVRQAGIPPLGRVCGYAFVAGEPESFTERPLFATKTLCRDLGWRLEDVDLFEVNEAFATVPILFHKILNVPYEKINVQGGACTLGHPLGCSGARIVVTLLHSLKRLGKKRGIATLCIGGGEGLALAVERD